MNARKNTDTTIYSMASSRYALYLRETHLLRNVWHERTFRLRGQHL